MQSTALFPPINSHNDLIRTCGNMHTFPVISHIASSLGYPLIRRYKEYEYPGALEL